MASKGPVPQGLRIKDLTFSGVPVRLYEPTAASGEKKRGLVYFHGGGWMFGCIGNAVYVRVDTVKYCCVDILTSFDCPSTDDYDEVCQYISLESDTTVVSVGLADSVFMYKSS